MSAFCEHEISLQHKRATVLCTNSTRMLVNEENFKSTCTGYLTKQKKFGTNSGYCKTTGKTKHCLLWS